MKTKNIFRMLLVAVVLLLGANNAMAYTLTYKYTIEWQNETVYKTYQLNEGDPIVPEDTPTMEGYSFSGWGYIPETMPNYDLNVTGNFSAISYTITANATVNGSFYVDQSAKFGSEVTINIYPNSGYEVDEVTVTAADGSNIDVTDDNKFTMPAQDVTVTVTFKAKTFTLTWAIQGESEPYLTQQLATGEVIVEPDPAPAKVGYSFNGWWQHEQTMPAQDYTITGSFTAINYTIAITPSEHGSLSAYRETAHYGDEITIHPQADWGYQLEEGSVIVVDADNNTIPVSSDLKFTMPASNVTISGTFVSIAPSEKAQLNMSYSPSSVELTLGEEFTAPTLSIKDAQGNDVTGLTITYSSSNEGLATVATDGTVTLVEGATGSTTITATFAGDDNWNNAEASYTLTVTRPENADGYSITYNIIGKGTVTANKTTANEGDVIELTVSPEMGQQLKELVVRDESYGTIEMTDATHFIMPAKNVIVHATFEAIQYAITINSTEHGSLNVWRDTAPYNEEVTIYAQAEWGYQLEEGSVTVVDADNNTIPVSSDLKFTMPASAVTISGTFVSIAPSEKARLNMSYNPSSVELTLGEEFTAPTLSIKDAQGNDVTGLTITYSSSNEGLATVANDGTVTLVEGATGSTTITASFAGDETYEAASAQYTITVNKPKRQITLGENEHTIWDGTPEPTHSNEWNLLIDNSSNWVDNTNGTSKIRIYVDNQNEYDWKLWMGTYNWGNASWANWSNNGEVRNYTEGTTPYNAEGMYFEYEFSEYTKAAIVNGLAISFWGQEIVMVTHITVPEKPALTLTFSATNIDANTRQTEIDEPTLTVTNAAGEEVTGLTFTYISSDTDVAEVDAEGNVTLKGVEGTTTITVSTEGNDEYSGGTASYTITVTELTYTVSASEDIEHGTINITSTTYAEDADVTFTITPDEGYSLNAESVSITRTDNSESVNFTVDDGNYTFTMPASDVVISATFTINSHDVIYYVDGEEKYRDTYTYGADITVREKWADTDDTHYSEWTYSGGDIPTTMPDYDVELYSYSTGFAKVEITSSTGYTSFSSVRPLDFSQVEGITAYIVVDADLDGLTASLKEVSGEIAANTGLILKGSVGEYEIPTATSSGTSYSNNMLVAVSSATTFGNDAGCFLLVERNGQPLFAEANTGISKTLPANHAYLYVANASRAQGRYLSFVGDDVTGISNIEKNQTGNGAIYNLRGQKVEKPGKGLYIVNGKKMVLR